MDDKKFEKELYQSINAYFRSNNISRYANMKMYAKLFVAAFFWTGSLFILFMFGGSNWVFFFLFYAVHCFSQLYILLNIAHDANHSAIFRSKYLKRILTYSFDLCGLNSYMWRELHHEQHHYCMNIEGEDESLVARKLFRFTEKTEKKFIHKFQHLYFLILYGLSSADWVLTKDFECFFLPYTDSLRKMKHPLIEYIKLFVFKAAYIGYMIILPIYLLGYSFGFVLAVFMICHFMIGLVGATIIQITHPLHSADFPESRNDYPNFSTYIFATTADYSINSKIADYFFGGLHLHVIHHLCPNICHVHYRELTKIVAKIAAKYQVNYRVNRTMLAAIKEHYTLLKSLK